MHKTCYDIDSNMITENHNNNNVDLIVNNQRFPCKKNSLQNASPYFHAMFNSSMRESTAGEIYIRDVEPDVFKVLLDYAHNNPLPILTSNENSFNYVCELLKAACIFQFDEVSKHCRKHLSNSMDVSNCLKVWELADVLALPDLRSKAKSHVLWNGDLMLESEEILEASFDILLEVVSNDGLRVTSEVKNVLSPLINWVKENDIEKEKSSQLLKEIRLDDISSEDFQKISEGVKGIICETQPYEGNMRNNSPFELICNRTLRMRSVPLKPLLYGYSFQGRKNKLNIHFHIQEDMHFREISSTCVYVKTLTGFGVCVVGKDVYMFGGREKIHFGKWNQSMWKYDALKEEWMVMPPVKFSRRGFTCLTLENCIYVLGGYGEYRILQTSMLCYDIASGTWSEKASPDSISSNSFVSSFVAVSGFYHGTPVLFYFSTGVDIYFPKEDKWVQIQETAIVGGIQNAAEFQGLIYLMTQEPHGNGVMFYLYKPEKSEITPVARSLSEDCVNFTVLHNKIFIFTDNGVEIITAPPLSGCDGSQVMCKWRNEQRKPVNRHLKFVGLVPFYGE